jgi:hypothetical protein
MRETQLNQSEVTRYAHITHAVELDQEHPAEFGGKSVKRLKGIYSIPLGRRKRILVKRRQAGFTVERVVTHEAYNQIIAKRR